MESSAKLVLYLGMITIWYSRIFGLYTSATVPDPSEAALGARQQSLGGPLEGHDGAESIEAATNNF